jgi:hypothetical protein
MEKLGRGIQKYRLGKEPRLWDAENGTRPDLLIHPFPPTNQVSVQRLERSVASKDFFSPRDTVKVRIRSFQEQKCENLYLVKR